MDYRKVGNKGIPETIHHLCYEYAVLLAMCDEKLGEILDLMGRYGMRKDTMPIVNTDHDFLPSEHGQWTKCHYSSHNEVVRIPLFIWDPVNQERGKHMKNLV